MHRFVYRAPIWAVLLLLLAACAGASPPAGAPATASDEASATTLTAVKVEAVTVDGTDATWEKAPVLSVSTVGATEDAADGPDVHVQAMYDDQTLALRFEWADATESVMKAAWTWDGTAFTKSGDEDRVQLIFPIANDPEFSGKGCAAICHNMDADPDTWYMSSNDEALSYDVIHWKSARTNPYLQADDQVIRVRADPEAESGRVGDAKEGGGYADNINEAADGPSSMHATDPAAQFIMRGEEVPLDTGALAAGAVIPGFVLSPFTGSRGDQTAQGTWLDGTWVVVVKRSLDTGHDDDVVFTPPKAYPFGLSITDNGGGTAHTIVPDILTLTWQ